MPGFSAFETARFVFDVEIGWPLSLHASAPFEMIPPGASTPPPEAPLATATLYVEAPGTGDQVRIVGFG